VKGWVTTGFSPYGNLDSDEEFRTLVLNSVTPVTIPVLVNKKKIQAPPFVIWDLLDSQECHVTV
jgi:hypothetical protein